MDCNVYLKKYRMNEKLLAIVFFFKIFVYYRNFDQFVLGYYSRFISQYITYKKQEYEKYEKNYISFIG